MKQPSFLFKIILICGCVFYTTIITHALTHKSKLIAPDKVWEYIQENWSKSNDPQYPSDNVMRTISKFRYQFEDTEESFGKSYSQWVLKDIESWSCVTWWEDPGEGDPDFDYSSYKGEYEHHSEWIHEFREINETIALIREENGKVYTLIDTDEVIKYQDHVLVDIQPIPGDEAILYDMSAEYNQSFPILGENLYLCEAFLTDAFDYIYDNMSFRGIGIVTDYGWAQSYSNYGFSQGTLEEMWSCTDFLKNSQTKFIEGIGVISGGTLTDAYLYPYALPTCYCYSLTYLLRVSEQDTIIYENSEVLPDVAALKHPDVANMDRGNKIYDLMGRDIRDPQPGTVYIRGGKKYVAR